MALRKVLKTALTLAIITILATVSVVGASSIKLVIDEKIIVPKDVNGNVVEVINQNGTTFLPIRAIGEALGKDVEWVGETKTAIVGDNKLSDSVMESLKNNNVENHEKVQLVVDKKIVMPKDETGKEVTLFIQNGTTYVPVRAVGEALGKTVNWDAGSRTVVLGKYNPNSDLYKVEKAEHEISDELFQYIGQSYTDLNNKYNINELDSYYSTEILTTYKSVKTGYWFGVRDFLGDSCTDVFAPLNKLFPNLDRTVSTDDFKKILEKNTRVSNIHDPIFTFTIDGKYDVTLSNMDIKEVRPDMVIQITLSSANFYPIDEID